MTTCHHSIKTSACSLFICFFPVNIGSVSVVWWPDCVCLCVSVCAHGSNHRGDISSADMEHYKPCSDTVAHKHQVPFHSYPNLCFAFNHVQDKNNIYTCCQKEDVSAATTARIRYHNISVSSFTATVDFLSICFAPRLYWNDLDICTKTMLSSEPPVPSVSWTKVLPRWRWMTPADKEAVNIFCGVCGRRWRVGNDGAAFGCTSQRAERSSFTL